MSLFKQLIQLERAASDLGFKWKNPTQIMAQIESECIEVREHLNAGISLKNQSALQEEIGDLLHAVFSLCVFCHMNPEETLSQSLNKFERRLNAVKVLACEQGLYTLEGHSFEQLMHVWNEAKKLVG